MISLSLGLDRRLIAVNINLPASKSESNRALIIQAISSNDVVLKNISSARDTQTMLRLLSSSDKTLDVLDAGTTMRFLTAYMSAVGKEKILTGTPRMQKRPIGELVKALNILGANITYKAEEGFPPLHIKGKGPLTGGEVHLKGNISSQFITALLLIGPYLTGGLTIKLIGKIYSKPYIEMTLSMMDHFGVKAEVDWEDQLISIAESSYQSGVYTIESDWSAASYWYSIVALADKAEVFLSGLRDQSWQGDRGIVEIMQHFGVETTFKNEGILLTKGEPKESPSILALNFKHIPDMAQTVAVMSAAMNIPVRMSGIESLRIKETDRIHALQNELSKFGVKMIEESPDVFLISGTFHPSELAVETYEDHRMAMAFAPLILRQPTLHIEDPQVVRKSYPEFWDHLQLAGITHTFSD